MSSTPATSLNPSAFTLASNTASTSSAFLRPAGSMESSAAFARRSATLSLASSSRLTLGTTSRLCPWCGRRWRRWLLPLALLALAFLLYEPLFCLVPPAFWRLLFLLLLRAGAALPWADWRGRPGFCWPSERCGASVLPSASRRGAASEAACGASFAGASAASGMASLRVLLMRAAGLSEACSVGEPAASGAGASMSFFVRRAGFGASAAASSAAGRFAAAARRRGCWGFAGTACSAASVATGAIASFMLMPSALSPSP